MTDRQTPPGAERPLTVLVEMRPAFDGFAGIPQETRLLFKGLCLLPSVAVQGLLQTSLRFLPAGMAAPRGGAGDALADRAALRQAQGERSEVEAGSAASVRAPASVRASESAPTPESSQPEPSEAERLGHYARFVLSLDGTLSKKPLDLLSRYMQRREAIVKQTVTTLLMPRRRIPLTWFEPLRFETVVWQALFAKTLAPQDQPLVTSRNFRVCTVPWNILQSTGLASLRFGAGRVARYPRLGTAGVDVFIAQTPYPGRVDAGTALVVRYHDALPVFMSPAFANKARHQATHFQALRANVEAGAWFACVSEATRQDLLRIFPELGERAVTIHNMVSPHFFDEPSPAHRVRHIVRRRINPSPLARPDFGSLREHEAFYARHLGVVDAVESAGMAVPADADGVAQRTPQTPTVAAPAEVTAATSATGASGASGTSSTEPLRYLLMVSTLEPRKNHVQLVAAWEAVRAACDPSLKLVLVGSLGWDVEPILAEMRNWIDRGQLFMLSGVPAADLRALYRHAAATVCPSLAEGFDFSGVEAICSGGVPVASDIAVHREVYGDAAEYFDPAVTDSLVAALRRVLYEPVSAARREALAAQAAGVARRYLPEAILPQWDTFLHRVAAHGAASIDAPTAAPCARGQAARTAARGPTQD